MADHAWYDWPIGAARLIAGSKSFERNPWLTEPGYERDGYGLHVQRALLAERMADRRRAAMKDMLEADDRSFFARNGYIVKEDFLAPAQFERVREEALGLQTDIREMRQGPAVTRRVTLDPADRGQRPHSVAAMQDARLQNLLRYVASHDAQPLCYVQAIIAEEARNAIGETDPQTDLHFDTFFATAKAWLFLHDVEEADGPFAYVPGSHRMSPARCAWEQEQTELILEHPDRMHRRGSLRVTAADLEAMGLPEPQKMTVKANTLVVADTHGAHGRSPISEPCVRVELYATLRRYPFSPIAGGDLLAFSPFARRGAGTILSALDLQDRIRRSFGSEKRHPWRKVSARRMDAPGAD
ncbi:MAG: phytanoyl-CoA dioxygenase family protein [Neomegalonema sp.]|nr:phytanoyl-CoA dioxygenase family protein [Neomegalonema sp.]